MVNRGGKCLCLRWSALQTATTHHAVQWHFQRPISNGSQRPEWNQKKLYLQNLCSRDAGLHHNTPAARWGGEGAELSAPELSAPVASVCSPAETRQLPTPSALAGGKSKGTGVCCGSAKLPFIGGGGGIFKSRIGMAAGGSSVPFPAAGTEAHRSVKDSSVSLQAQSSHLPIHQMK